jgi:hypothetical protein
MQITLGGCTNNMEICVWYDSGSNSVYTGTITVTKN